MDKTEVLIKKIEETKEKYHSVGFKKITENYFDKTEIIKINSEWRSNIGEFDGIGETLNKSLEDLLYKLENFPDFKEALEKEKRVS